MFLLVLIQIMKWISLNYIEKKSLLFSIFKMKMTSVKEISSFIIQFLHIKELGFIEGCKAAANYIRANVDYSSINAMIMNEKQWVVICEHHTDRAPDWAPDDYYELKYKSDALGVLVASTGWNQPGWTVLPNHYMLVIDRDSFAVEVMPL